MNDIKYLEEKAHEIRTEMLNACIATGTGHLTSSLSCVDILVALYHGEIMLHYPYDPDDKSRDRFILSKAHASPALYAVLADCGYFKKNKLLKTAKKDGIFGIHTQMDVPGIEITAGALGHGFGISVGMALTAKRDRKGHLVFSLLSDGECYEGSIWESAMFAANNNLNNLTAIIDRNYLCATDFTEDFAPLEPLRDKWLSFGWIVEEIDGNNMSEIINSLKHVRSRRHSRPKVIIAKTVKGAGIDYICDSPLWHSSAPRGADVIKCRKSLKEGRV